MEPNKKKIVLVKQFRLKPEITCTPWDGGVISNKEKCGVWFMEVLLMILF